MTGHAALFAEGPFSERVEDRRKEVAEQLRQAFGRWARRAEQDGRFPRELLAELGRRGLLRQRWEPAPDGDPGLGVVIAEESGRLAEAGLSVGLSLQCETVASVLSRYASNPLHRDYLAGVLDGRLVGCFGASEPAGGSDLGGMRTTARRIGGGWQVRGEKKFLSLGLICDFALLLCRIDDEGGPARGLGLFAVPARGLTPRKRLSKAGTAALDTTWMLVDAKVGDEALIGRPGAGLLPAVWGLSHERLSIAAQVAGSAERAIGLATAHLQRRVQFGRPLMDQQALRLRLAELAARQLTLRYAVYAAAQGLAVPGACGAREVAALKVTAARFAEEVMSECMHLFGGAGYLLDETPLARMWRDARLARLGGGTDEMMWELVAGGLVPDDAGYDDMVDLG
jgi:alkylation response protein AidB-like acyl-CoA dehydrogenase